LLSAGLDDPDADATIDHLIEQVARLLQARSDVLGARGHQQSRWSNLDGYTPEDLSHEMHRFGVTDRYRPQDAA
jgi:hypothetical protein